MKEYKYECSQTGIKYSIWVGESAQDNWDIISAAEYTDIWFHVEKIPSCHVILLSNNTPIKNIHKNVIKYCAALCKEGSKQKNYSKVSIIYTEIQNVTINKKGDVGSVMTRKTTKIIV